MARGILYAMTTVVPGLIKIGKTQSSQFENRMYQLERNGYSNVVGLKRHFAIEVDAYDEKERLLDDIFSKSRVPNTELFALDIDLVTQLLTSFEGTQVYPAVEPKEEVFKQASKERAERVESAMVPDGVYYMERKLKKEGNVVWEAQMEVDEGNFIIRAGQHASVKDGPGLTPNVIEARVANIDERGVVISDVAFTTPSAAGSFVTGAACNGWVTWKTGKGSKGKKIDCFRRKQR